MTPHDMQDEKTIYEGQDEKEYQWCHECQTKRTHIFTNYGWECCGCGQ